VLEMSSLVYPADVQTIILPTFITAYLGPPCYSRCDEFLQLTENCRHRHSMHHIFPNLKVSELWNAGAMGRVMHVQFICQETLHWRRLRLVYGNMAVSLLVEISWYHLCDPVAVALCNLTASQKTVNMVNPDVMRQI
jgi:hypothetical protein